MILTIRKRTLVAVMACIILLAGILVYFCTRQTFSPALKYCIVIDAGHGGIDGGAVGKITNERDINLEYAQQLKEICQSLGMRVVMTRTDENGLYNPLAANKKRSDMEKRKEIIENSGADLVVSVHMNAFVRGNSRGAQAFYGLENGRGKALAEKVQQSLHNNINYAKALPKEGDFYILNCTKLPGVLVEFGFLSNVEEEKLLLSETYKNQMCKAVANGVLSFYEMN